MANNTKPSGVTPGYLVEVYEMTGMNGVWGTWNMGLIIAVEDDGEVMTVMTRFGLLRLSTNPNRGDHTWGMLCKSEEAVV
jgi:hypothetical protein